RALTKCGESLAEAPHFLEFRRNGETSGVIDVSPFAALRRWTESLAERPDAAAIPVELRPDHYLAAAVDESGMAAHLDAGEAIGEIARVLVCEGHHDLAGGIDESILAVEHQSRAAVTEIGDVLIPDRHHELALAIDEAPAVSVADRQAVLDPVFADGVVRQFRQRHKGLRLEVTQAL